MLNVAYPTLSTVNSDRMAKAVTLSTKVFDKKKQIKIVPNQGVVVAMDDKLNKVRIDFIKENKPKKGESFREQLKLLTKKKIKAKSKKGRVIKKYFYTSEK